VYFVLYHFSTKFQASNLKLKLPLNQVTSLFISACFKKICSLTVTRFPNQACAEVTKSTADFIAYCPKLAKIRIENCADSELKRYLFANEIIKAHAKLIRFDFAWFVVLFCLHFSVFHVFEMKFWFISADNYFLWLCLLEISCLICLTKHSKMFTMLVSFKMGLKCWFWIGLNSCFKFKREILTPLPHNLRWGIFCPLKNTWHLFLR